MGSQMVQILVLAGVAIFLVLRLRDVLGTRDGFEKPFDPEAMTPQAAPRKFEVIEGGGEDRDIADHVDVDSASGNALAAMKRVEPAFSVGEFTQGARQAYEMILMAFENGDTEFLRDYLAPDVFETFSSAIEARNNQGLTVEANFIGVREVKLREAQFDAENLDAEITMKFVGELTSVVRNEAGEVVEGSTSEVKRQSDRWTFARLMGGDNPNWLLVGTGA